MALILCPECQSSVSDTAPTCPHCGYVNPAGKPRHLAFLPGAFSSKHRNAPHSTVAPRAEPEKKKLSPLAKMGLFILIAFALYLANFAYNGFTVLGWW